MVGSQIAVAQIVADLNLVVQYWFETEFKKSNIRRETS